MDKPLLVRPLMREAGPAWLPLMNSSLQDCPGFEPLIDLDFLRLWGGDRAMAGLVLGADCDGQLLGAISLIFGKRRGRLRDLVVRPNSRRRGIGTALVEAAVDRFCERGLSLVEAQDWDVPPYRAFYAALGFHPVRRYLLLRWDLAQRLPTLLLNQAVAVHPATGADVEEMADLYARMYSPYWDWSREGTLEEVREAYRARFAQRLTAFDSDRVYLVAALKGRLVGGITVRIDEAYNRVRGVGLGSLNPGGVGVLPAYRRQGIGSRLVTDALLLLRERGMRQVTVWTFSHLESPTPAVVLYRRTGATVARRCLGWEKTG